MFISIYCLVEVKNMENIIRYSDYSKTGRGEDLTPEDLKNVKWVRYKIIVPTEEDKIQLEQAFEHIHYADIDTDIVAVNQLAHEYLTSEKTGDENIKNNIIVNKELFEKLL